MLKSIVHESSFVEYFKGYDDFRCGFLIGGSSGNEEHLFLPIQMPAENQTTVVKCVADLDENWVTSRWRNLQRMLPGGVRISGLCLTLPSTDFNTAEVKMKKIFNNLPEVDPVLEQIIGPFDNEKLLLFVDVSTLKFTCKVLDRNVAQSHFRPISIKSRAFLDSYVAYKTHVNLSLETTLPADRKKEQILLQLRDAVQPYLTALLTDAKLLVNGDILNGPDPVLKSRAGDLSAIHTSPTEKRGKKTANKATKRRSTVSEDDRGDSAKSRHRKATKSQSNLDHGSWAEVELTIFGSQFPQWQRVSSSSSLDSGTSSDTGHTGSTDMSDWSTGLSAHPINRLIVNGRIPGIAYLPADTTVAVLFQALRQDLIQSILARLELLTDELHITSAELEIPRMLLPQRVIVRLPVCPSLPLCDYKFLSETANDVVSRLHYICVPLGVQSDGDNESTLLDSHPIERSIFPAKKYSAGVTSGHTRSPSLPNHLDASCLDISLEQSPESSVVDEFSEAELLENVTQTVQPVTKYISLSNPAFLLLTGSVLICSLLVLLFSGSSSWIS